MITVFPIESFKGIRDRVKTDIKPTTLLFGPNSADRPPCARRCAILRVEGPRRDTTKVGHEYFLAAVTAEKSGEP